MSIDRRVADLAGQAALPRKNGELVFEAPWEGRALGMAVVLSQGGRYDWEEFRQRLIQQIGQAEPEQAYYASWLAALEALLLDKGLLSPAELATRTADFESGARDEVF